MYVSFDEIPEGELHKEREACYQAGVNGEKLAKYITDKKDEHGKNVSALRSVMAQFASDEPKKRLHTKVKARYEQERKYVKHYEGCAADHKRGAVVFDLKTKMEKAAKEHAAKLRAAHEAHLKAQNELRKVCEVENRKKFEAELAAKKKAKKAKPKKRWYDWALNLFKSKKNDAQKPTPTPSSIMKSVQEMTPEQREQRKLYLIKKQKERNDKKAA